MKMMSKNNVSDKVGDGKLREKIHIAEFCIDKIHKQKRKMVDKSPVFNSKYRGRFSVLTDKQRITYNAAGEATCREQQERRETAGSIM